MDKIINFPGQLYKGDDEVSFGVTLKLSELQTLAEVLIKEGLVDLACSIWGDGVGFGEFHEIWSRMAFSGHKLEE